MSWDAVWAEVDRRIERRVNQVRGAIRAVLQSSTPTTKAPELAVEGLADEQVPTVELFQQYGFRSIPPKDAEVILVQVGGRGGHLVAIATAARDSAPTDLEDEDAALYSAGGARVVCWADGSLTVEAAGGATVELDTSGNVTLNGGSKGVARKDDACSPSAGMTTWISSVSSALASLTGGAFPPPTDSSYTISGASTTVKAG